MDLAALSSNPLNGSVSATPDNSLAALGSDEFLQLMITDLLNQDPLEPMDNEQLLQQLASIRELEVNSRITSSLESLVGQQQFGSSANLIGTFVEGAPGSGVAGLVVGVRFDESGGAILKLANGTDLPLAQLNSISSAEQFANALKGRMVTAELQQDGQTEIVEGIVTEVKNNGGQYMLELDTGQQVALTQVRSYRTSTA